MKKFIVEGEGDFPLDMLRYDHCYPTGIGDVMNMMDLESSPGKRQVQLKTVLKRCTYKRSMEKLWVGSSRT